MIKYLMSLFKIIRMIFCVASLYIALLNVFYIFHFLKWRKQGESLEASVGNFFAKKNVIIMCELILMFGIIFSPQVFSHFQNTNIGSFLEKDTYNECYYIYFRKDKNSSVYQKLKADIFKEDYGYESYTDEGDETFVIQGNGYFIEKIYLENGDCLNFIEDDDLIYETTRMRLYPGKETQVTDCNDNDYYVTLTYEKAE